LGITCAIAFCLVSPIVSFRPLYLHISKDINPIYIRHPHKIQQCESQAHFPLSFEVMTSKMSGWWPLTLHLTIGALRLSSPDRV
jgi:hypothetical protein